MNPAWSVIFLTTLIGTGQGLFLALFGVDAAGRLGVIASVPAQFFVSGAVVALLLLSGGLAASFFHLGHPERAWRAVAMWRTSWLSREVIVLPLFMATVASFAYAHATGLSCAPWTGAIGVLLCLALFVCTAMIYICLKFLQEWHTPLTFVNFLLLGTASGVLLAAVLANVVSPVLAAKLAVIAGSVTALAAVTRGLSLARNARLRPHSTLQTAIGIANPKIAQKAQGAMGGSFNTREFFHGRTAALVCTVKWFFLLGVFMVPLALIAFALLTAVPQWLAIACGVQYAGLLAERWFFFAQARHPQNIYYQAIS